MAEHETYTSRIVWHPDVHRHLGEMLCFFLLNVRSSQQPTRDQIQKIVKDMNLRGYCYYEVFGSVDVILRVWVRTDTRATLQAKLSELTNVSVRSVILCTESPLYTWWEGYRERVPIGEILTFPSNRLIAAQSASPPADILKDLTERGLLCVRPKFQNGQWIKFYVIVNVYGVVNRKGVVEELERALKDADYIGDKSVYFGQRTEYLVKGTAKDYYRIWAFITAITEKLRTVECTTETHLIAAPPGAERDDVDFEGALIHPDLVRLCQIWGIDIALVQKLPTSKQKDLAETFGLASRHGLLEKTGDPRSILRDCFEFAVHEDLDSMAERFLFLAEMERKLFAPIVPKLMKQAYGADWIPQHLQRIRDAVGKLGEYKNNAWTLGDSVGLLGKACAEHPELTAELGCGWEPVLRTAIQWRNDFAHGKLLDRLGEWPKVVNFLVQVLPVYYSIRALAAREDGAK